MKVAYITNASPQSGMGKPAREIAYLLRSERELQLQTFRLDETPLRPWPGPLNAKPFRWLRAARTLPHHGFDVWHLTNQSLSFISRRPAVITVYDLIERIEPQTRFARTVYRYLYRGIPHAAHIICISAYTRKTLQELYAVPDDRLSVIPLAAAAVFEPIPDAKHSLGVRELLHQLQIPASVPIVLYVGSEHPRKNLDVLIQAFAKLRQEIPNAVLIKVGDPGVAAGRVKLLATLQELGIRDSVRLLGNADDEILKLLYNLADVFVFPSRFEGFGVPPLEAMACGCPVIVSNATSLPEVVGDAALMHDPQDTDGFANSMKRVLTEKNLSQHLRTLGLAQAAKFQWKDIAQKTFEIYEKVVVASNHYKH